MASTSREVVLQLYRTLLKKARRATHGYDYHMFRFQEDASQTLWGKGVFYDISNDHSMLQRIFPQSAHKYINNNFKFSNDKFNININNNNNNNSPLLFGKYTEKSPTSKALSFSILQEEGNHKINPIPIQTDPTPSNSSLAKHMIKTEYNYYRLKQLIYNCFNDNKNIDDESRLLYIKEGFNVSKELDNQILINECTSVSESNGIRIIVISKHLPNIQTSNSQYIFTYQIRIENHGRKWSQLLGRHWIIQDENGKIQEVEKYQPGVVGHTPVIEGAKVFLYGSGLHLDTPNGIMKGSFQFTRDDGQLFEVPIAPFKLIAFQQDRDST